MSRRFPFLLLVLLLTAGTCAAKPTGQTLSFARYFYGYQANPRKSLAAGIPSLGTDGSSRFTVQPSVGIGPWFGYGHAMWHRDNLVSMRRSGIDVALPVFRPDAASLAGYAENGLLSMTQALIELKRERQDYPMIGMFYDFPAGEAAWNVSIPEGKARFYDGIRRFFRHVPEEFRALAPTENGLACIVMVGAPQGLTGVSADLRTYCDTQFQKDFGRRLLWVGDPAWKSAAGNLDGYAAFHNGGPMVVNSDGPLTVATIGPGRMVFGSTEPIRSRNGSEAMMDDWRALFQQKFDWLIVETWNDYTSGSAVAPTRQYGVREMDLVTAGMHQFRNEMGPFAQALHVNAPDVMLPKTVAPVEIVIQNGTLDTWQRAQVSASASWFQDGKLVDKGPLLPVLQEVPVMGLLTVPVTLVSAKADGTPLPEGLYEVRVEMVRHGRDAEGKQVEEPFPAPVAVLPMRIGNPGSDRARMITNNAMPWLMAGVNNPVTVILRNEGATPWPRGSTTVQWRLLATSGGTTREIASGKSSTLETIVQPGEVSPEVTMDVKPPVETSADTSRYELAWSVLHGANVISVNEAPGAEARRTVRVLPLVSIAHFPLGNNAPAQWPAGTESEIRTVVRNLSPVTWKASEVQLGYHWYYWDGTEALWDSPRTPLPRDLKPGEEVMVRLKTTAPSVSGPYILAVDAWDGKQWLSTLPVTAGYDMSIAWVNVTGGAMRPLDLTGLFDVDGIAGEGFTADGEFADRTAYPGEQVPPDVLSPLPMANTPRLPFPPGITPALYPAGYFGPVDTVGLRSIRRIPFRFPGKKQGERNFMFARAQTLPVGRGSYQKLFILAAGLKETEGVWKLNYADGTSDSAPVSLSAWTTGPQHGESIGLVTSFVRKPDKDDPVTKAYLYVYEIQVDASKTLDSISFPSNRDIRIAAITAEERSGVTLNP